jgi:uncharacterized membrane protein YesL
MIYRAGAVYPRQKGKSMFISLSKTLAKCGGFRLGLGMRMTKKNSAWVLFILLFVWMFKLTWYMMVVCFWLFYAVCYGLIWCIKKPFQKLNQKG